MQALNEVGLGERCMCGAGRLERLFFYDRPPEGEVRFRFSSAGDYRRDVLRCTLCGHFLSVHTMDVTDLYAGEYVSATYGDDGLRRSFDRVNMLPPERSDNVGRVRRILDFASRLISAPAQESRPPSVLDVGSGLCVFLYRMKQAGWAGTALDRDRRQAAHARDVVGVEAICGDLGDESGLGRFDLVTFNKVLEHVDDPIALLAKSADHLLPGGVVYVEVPDGEAAVRDGPGREEFFIDHPHIFSAVSLAFLARRAGFIMLELERLQEPSMKYTLRVFLTSRAAS